MRDKSNWTKNQNNPNGLSFSCMYVNVEEVLPEVQRCRVIYMPKKGYTYCLTKDTQPADDRTACYVERCLCFDLLNHSKYISRMWCNRNTPALGAGVAVQI